MIAWPKLSDADSRCLYPLLCLKMEGVSFLAYTGVEGAEAEKLYRFSFFQLRLQFVEYLSERILVKGLWPSVLLGKPFNKGLFLHTLHTKAGKQVLSSGTCKRGESAPGGDRRIGWQCPLDTKEVLEQMGEKGLNCFP